MKQRHTTELSIHRQDIRVQKGRSKELKNAQKQINSRLYMLKMLTIYPDDSIFCNDKLNCNFGFWILCFLICAFCTNSRRLESTGSKIYTLYGKNGTQTAKGKVSGREKKRNYNSKFKNEDADKKRKAVKYGKKNGERGESGKAQNYENEKGNRDEGNENKRDEENENKRDEENENKRNKNELKEIEKLAKHEKNREEHKLSDAMPDISPGANYGNTCLLSEYFGSEARFNFHQCQSKISSKNVLKVETSDHKDKNDDLDANIHEFQNKDLYHEKNLNGLVERAEEDTNGDSSCCKTEQLYINNVWQCDRKEKSNMRSSTYEECCGYQNEQIKPIQECSLKNEIKSMCSHAEGTSGNEYQSNMVSRGSVTKAQLKEGCHNIQTKGTQDTFTTAQDEDRRLECTSSGAQEDLLTLFNTQEVKITNHASKYDGVENGCDCKQCTYAVFDEITLRDDVPDLSFNSDDDELFDEESSVILSTYETVNNVFDNKGHNDTDMDISMQKMLVTHRRNLKNKSSTLSKEYNWPPRKEKEATNISLNEEEDCTDNNTSRLKKQKHKSLHDKYSFDIELMSINISGEMTPLDHSHECPREVIWLKHEIVALSKQRAKRRYISEKGRTENDSGFCSLKSVDYEENEIEEEILRDKKKIRSIILGRNWPVFNAFSDVVIYPLKEAGLSSSSYDANSSDLQVDSGSNSDHQDTLDGPGLNNDTRTENCSSRNFASIDSEILASHRIPNDVVVNGNLQPASRFPDETSASNQLFLEEERNPLHSTNSLGSYFRGRVAGIYYSTDECMCYEWLRLRTFEDYPVTVPVCVLLLARVGFYATGNNDEVKCFSCEMKYTGFKLEDKPTEIHQKRSPKCRMVLGIERTNIPIFKQDEAVHVLGAEATRYTSQNNIASLRNGNESPVPLEYHNASNSRNNMPHTSIQQSLVTTDQGNSFTFHQSEFQTPQRYTEVSASLTRSPIGGGDRAEELGINIERPKYPAYAHLNVRVSTYSGWPGYLDQSPRDMALAGFFFTGHNDYCRCFYCGGGLRSWDAGDDPWVEHARWFSKCSFVRQNRGHRFVEIIAKRQAEMQVNCTGTNPGKEIAVLAKPSNMQTYAPSTNLHDTSRRATQNQILSVVTQPPLATTTDALSKMNSSIESIRELGYSLDITHRAIDVLKRQNPGKEKFEATDILEVIFNIDDGLEETNTTAEAENHSSNTQHSRQRENHRPQKQPQAAASSRKSKSKCSVPSENATSTPPSLSVNSLEDRTGPQDTSVHEASESGTQATISVSDIRSLQEENLQLKEQVMCKICMDKNVSIAFLPCGHLACCIDCAPAMRKCPMCRVFIKGTVKTYLA